MKVKVIPPPAKPEITPGTLWRRIRGGFEGHIYLAIKPWGYDTIHLYDTEDFKQVWTTGSNAPWGWGGIDDFEYVGKLEIER